MKYLSLFSGIGGFELGIQQAFSELVSGCETLPNTKNKADAEPENDSRFIESRNQKLEHYGLLDNRPTGSQEQEGGVDKNRSNAEGKYAWQPPTCIGFSEIDKYATAIECH